MIDNDNYMGNTYLYQINVTRDCNLRCTHCYIHSESKDKSETMSDKEILKIAKDILEHMNNIKYRHAEIHIVGGEPTMLGLDFFVNIIPKIRGIFKGAGFSYELMLVSNLISEDIVDIAKLFDRVTTSYEIDSRFVSLKGNYKPALEYKWEYNVKKLQDHGVLVGVTTAITKPVVDYGARNLLDKFYKMNLKNIHFGFFIPEGDGLENIEKIMPTFEQSRDFLIESAEWYLEKRDKDKDLWVNPFESMLSAVFTNSPLDDIVCPIISGSMDINWDGNVATCLEAGGAKNPEWLGNIFEDSISNVAKSNKFVIKIKEVSKPQRICESCEEYSVCKSACSVLFRFFDEKIDKECPGFKGFIKFVRRKVREGVKPRYLSY